MSVKQDRIDRLTEFAKKAAGERVGLKIECPAEVMRECSSILTDILTCDPSSFEGLILRFDPKNPATTIWLVKKDKLDAISKGTLDQAYAEFEGGGL